MQILEKIIDRNRLSILNDIPVKLSMYQGSPGLVHFKNGEKGHIGCIGCINPRCMYFSIYEIECDSVKDFPNDKSLKVCPVEAITWDNLGDFPKIDTIKCINCGICVSRCPVGALYFSNEGVLRLNNIGENFIIKNEKPDIECQRIHFNQIRYLLNVPRTGVLLNASDQLFESIYNKLNYLKNNYHNFIGRNLLIALGCRCSIRRIGDVYTRMDAIYSTLDGSVGAIEIEFGKDTLEALRGILDDIVVLAVRYRVDKNNKSIVICLQLPNIRQGYWQVIKDIKKILGIKIGTITIGALMILLWNGCTFNPENDRYYIDYDNMNLRNIIYAQIKNKDICLSYKKLGILEPEK